MDATLKELIDAGIKRNIVCYDEAGTPTLITEDLIRLILQTQRSFNEFLFFIPPWSILPASLKDYSNYFAKLTSEMYDDLLAYYDEHGGVFPTDKYDLIIAAFNCNEILLGAF